MGSSVGLGQSPAWFGPHGYSWRHLNHLQIGRYAEYLVKMACTLHGFDVYGAEVDDRGIDFVLRAEPVGYYDVQVKSLRGSGYVFAPKSTFEPITRRLVAVVQFIERAAPSMYLIPGTSWQTPTPLLVGRDYLGMKSPPEWGVNMSKKNRAELEQHRFDLTARKLAGNPHHEGHP